VPVLVALDVMGIQRFVFASNRLRDVVGASQLVEEAVSRDGWIGELAPAGSVLTASGGNAQLRFPDPDTARSFTARYSRRVVEFGAGLQVAVAHRPYSEGALAAALLAVQVDLHRSKGATRPSMPLLGLGVTAVCPDTGRPAVDVRRDPDGRLVPQSALALAARDWKRSDRARKRWRAFLPRGLPDGMGAADFPVKLDDLGGTSGERSLLGVVHVDGNGVGRLIARWLRDRAETGAADDEVAGGLREWSGALTALGEGALHAAADRLGRALRVREDGRAVVGGADPDLEVALDRTPGGEWFLPLRPILLGGDDLTFVCDGRLALDLGVAAAEALGGDVPGLGPVSACAGVAILPLKTPFARAYELAEGLCASAKRARRDEGWGGGAVDWQVGAVHPGEPVESVRTRLHRTGGAATDDLTLRPYRLGSADGDPRSWEWFRDELLGTGVNGLRGGLWAQRHAKAVGLAALAREGPEAVDRALRGWRVSAPALGLPPPLAGGYHGQRTPLVDAAELLDRAQTLAAAVDGAGA